MIQIFKINCGNGCTTLNVLKNIWFVYFSGWIIWYVNYISIKFLYLKNKVYCLKNLLMVGKKKKKENFLWSVLRPSSHRYWLNFWISSCKAWVCLGVTLGPYWDTDCWLGVGPNNLLVVFFFKQIHTFIYLFFNTLKSFRGTASHGFCVQWLWQEGCFGLWHKPRHCFHEHELPFPRWLWFYSVFHQSYWAVLCFVHISTSLP